MNHYYRLDGMQYMSEALDLIVSGIRSRMSSFQVDKIRVKSDVQRAIRDTDRIAETAAEPLPRCFRRHEFTRRAHSHTKPSYNLSIEATTKKQRHSMPVPFSMISVPHLHAHCDDDTAYYCGSWLRAPDWRIIEHHFNQNMIVGWWPPEFMYL